MKNFNFDYDSESDDLFVYLQNQKSEGAVELGNFVLDFDKTGDLVAMQILNASEVFKKILSSFVNLNQIKEMKIEIINFRNMDAIKFQISTNSTKENANILIPHIRERSPVLSH